MAAVTYVVGAGALALRLAFAHFPARMVIGELPREFAITIGLTEVVLPTAGVAILLTIGAYWADFDTRAINWKRDAAAVGAVAAVPVLIAAVLAYHRLDGWGTELLWLLPACVVVAIIVAGAARAISWIREHVPGARIRKLAALGAVVAVPLAAGFVMVSGGLPLEDVRVCGPAGPYKPDGQLIGHSKEQVVVGIDEGEREYAVVFPASGVTQVLIGELAPAGERVGCAGGQLSHLAQPGN